MFKTETLLAFLQVARHGSFTKAANLQGQTPMAMSKQVSQLESRLGESLFERSTRKVKLTEFGQAFLARATHIFDQYDLLESWLESRQGKVVGTLRIVSQSGQTYDETVFPWLGEFHRLYPEIELHFDVEENVIDINEHPFDIYWGVADYLGNKHNGLKRRSLWRARYGIFAAPDYLARFGTPETPDDLASHHMVGHLHQQPGNILIVNKNPDSRQTDMEYVEIDAPIKTASSQVPLAVQGLGLVNALEDNHDVKSCLASGKLVPVLPEYWYSSAEIYIYYQQVKIEQPKVRVFVDFFLSKRPQW
jgi:DNA-binding transcriptional LysR family regulator